MRNRALCAVLLTALVCACIRRSDPPLRNTKVTRYSNGALRTLQEFIYDTIQDGTYAQYYENGGLAIEKYYSNNQREGKSIEYYETGKMKSLVHYHSDHEDGEARWYHANGALASWVIYKHGWKQSPGLTYYDTEEFKAAIAYGDSSKVIYRIDYNKDGSVLKESGERPAGWDALVARSGALSVPCSRSGVADPK